MKSYFKRNPYIILYLVILCLLTSCQTNKSILSETINEKNVNKEKLVFFDLKEYNEFGLLIFEKWNDGYECKYFYDDNNNLIASEQNTGIKTTFKKIDENTSIEYWSNGIVKMYEYKNGRLIKEYWSEVDYIEYFYDEKGNEESYRSSYGEISWNEYNDNNLLIYRKNSNNNEYFFDYEFWPNGTIKKRINYILIK
jgi:hypothetical protein